MPINTWWDGDPAQRYWMEVATTGSMGERLIAPKTSEATWSYELVSQVREGDRVLHWQASGGVRAFVGWSVATGDPAITAEYTWQPRGTSGRALAGPRTTEGWVVPLGGFNPLRPPFTADELQVVRDPVLAVRAWLEREHGKPIYFPFYLYGSSQLRAQQGYLVKFPVELFDVLPGIDAARSEGPAPVPEAEVTEDERRPKQRVARGRTTRIQDPLLRSAIETRAVDMAIEYYTSLGATKVKKLGKPYDIRLTLRGVERHVEVKGSSQFIETVELTVNEVTHARERQPTDLIVIDGIEWSRSGGNVVTSGGRLRIWSDWAPLDDDLAPRKYAYSLPTL